MSSAAGSRTTAPATCTAGSGIHNSEKSKWLTSANPARMPTTTKHAVRAMRSRCSRLSLAVMVRKAGTVAMGSTITKGEPNASTAFSIGAMGLPRSGLTQELGARINMRPLREAFVKCEFVRGDRCGHHDLKR